MYLVKILAVYLGGHNGTIVVTLRKCLTNVLNILCKPENGGDGGVKERDVV